MDARIDGDIGTFDEKIGGLKLLCEWFDMQVFQETKDDRILGFYTMLESLVADLVEINDQMNERHNSGERWIANRE